VVERRQGGTRGSAVGVRHAGPRPWGRRYGLPAGPRPASVRVQTVGGAARLGLTRSNRSPLAGGRLDGAQGNAELASDPVRGEQPLRGICTEVDWQVAGGAGSRRERVSRGDRHRGETARHRDPSPSHGLPCVPLPRPHHCRQGPIAEAIKQSGVSAGFVSLDSQAAYDADCPTSPLASRLHTESHPCRECR